MMLHKNVGGVIPLVVFLLVALTTTTDANDRCISWTYTDCTGREREMSCNLGAYETRQWKVSLQEAQDSCRMKSDCFGITRDNGGYEPRPGSSPHSHEAAHELWICEAEVCVDSCVGLPDGDYQSCTSCNVYATCVFGNLIDGRPCAAGLVWDDAAKQCMYRSTTCNKPAVTTERPDFNRTTPMPDYNYTRTQRPDFNRTTPMPDYNYTRTGKPDFNRTTPMPDYNYTRTERPDFNLTTPMPDYNYTRTGRPDFNATTPMPDYNYTRTGRPDFNTTTPMPDYNTSTLQILIVGGKSSNNAYTLKVDENGALLGGRVLSTNLHAVYHHAAAAIKGNSIYVAGGTKKATTVFEFMYDSVDEWKHFDYFELPELRYDRKYQPAVFILGDSIYVAGGSPYYFLSSRTMERYDPINDQEWTITDQTLPIDVANTATAVLQDRVYIIGGFTQSHWLPYYNPTLRTIYTWTARDKKMTKLAQMKKARYNHCAVSDGKDSIYVIGGVDYYKGVLSSAEVYHVEENRWQPRKAMPEELHSHACVYNDGLIYVIGGAKDRDEKKRVDTVWVYDTVANSWQLSATHLIEPASGHIAALMQPYKFGSY